MVVRKKTERKQACSHVSFHSLEKKEEGKLRKKMDYRSYQKGTQVVLQLEERPCG